MATRWYAEADLPEALKRQLPRGYDVVGHVAIVRLPEDLDLDAEMRQRVGEALIAAVPPARTAAVDRGVEGDLRTRDLEVLAGDPELVTEHNENGCRLLVDLERTYFSPRLAHERARVADQVLDDEHVLDLTCGVGPYAVLMAKRGAHVLACDVSPPAAGLARENARRNKVADRVQVVCADAPQLASSLATTFDRIVMNLPHTGEAHLPHAMKALADDGVIHLATMLLKDTHEEEAATIAEEHGLTLRTIRHVRNYNPAVGHYCLDLEP